MAGLASWSVSGLSMATVAVDVLVMALASREELVNVGVAWSLEWMGIFLVVLLLF